MMSESEDRLYARLRVFNAAMGSLHLLQGLAMLALSSSLTPPLRTTFLNSSGPPGTATSTVTRTVFDIRLGPMVAAFLLISSVAHFVLASPGVFPPLVDVIVNQLIFMPDEFFKPGAIGSQGKYMAEDLVDTGDFALATKGDLLADILAARVRSVQG